MVNNVAITTKTLSTNLGDTLQLAGDDMTIVTGEIGKGLLVFDPVGTLGVVTSYTSVDNLIVTTHAISIDINGILSINY